MRKILQKLLLCGITLLSIHCLPPGKASAQTVGIKTNPLGWGLYGTVNLGAEFGFARQFSVEVDGYYNPFTWNDYKKTNLFAIQGEIRYWFNHKFNGHFIGLHGHYGDYDWALKKYRYKGSLYGGGVSYGYSYMLTKFWSIEGNIGFGLTHFDNDYKYDRRDSRLTYPAESKNFWGPSRAGIRVIYLIK